MFGQNKHIWILIATGAVFVGLASSCAPDSEYSNSLGASAPFNQFSPGSQGNPWGPPPNDSNPNPGTTSGNPSNLPNTPSTKGPLIEHAVVMVGYRSYSKTVSTHSVLKVSFEPGINDISIRQAHILLGEAPGTNGFIPAYTKMAIAFQVGTTKIFTALLANGSTSAMQASQTIDLSTAFVHTCLPSDPACRQNVTLEYGWLNTTFYKDNYGYSTHYHAQNYEGGKGTIRIQTDDTVDLL